MRIGIISLESVCVSVCVSVQAISFEPLKLGGLSFRTYVSLNIKVRFVFCADFPGVSREKQNSNCVREKSLFYEAVDILAQRC